MSFFVRSHQDSPLSSPCSPILSLILLIHSLASDSLMNCKVSGDGEGCIDIGVGEKSPPSISDLIEDFFGLLIRHGLAPLSQT